MIFLTLHELTTLTVGLAVAFVAAVFVDISCAWRQEKELRCLRAALELQQEQQDRLDDDVDRLWAWASSWTDVVVRDDLPEAEPDPDDPAGPAPLAEEPATAVSHPADSFARKQHLLARPATSGQHRARPANDESASPAPAPQRTER